MSLSLIAIKTLCADRGKLLAAVVGVAFSVVLVNVQVGLYLGLIRKAGILVDHSEADIWVGHQNMHNVDFPRDIPRRWQHRVAAAPGVARVEPYLIGFSSMTLPSGGFEDVVVVGLEEDAQMGLPWNIDSGTWDSVRQADAVVVDAFDADKLEDPSVGDVREIGYQKVRVADKSRGILGFLVAPYVFTKYERASELLAKDPRHCSYFLVKVKPGADVDAVCREISARTPDLEAFPAATYSNISRDFWMTRTGIGISFGAATVLGLIVGLVMVAQTLHSLVLDRQAEFAALKAIGGSQPQLLTLVAVQALFMAVVGSLLGLVTVAAIQYSISSPRAPIETPLWLTGGSVLLVSSICLLAAFLPYLRIRAIDPLLVLQGS
jgi:putative ABC transport system permease protein